MPGTAVSLLGVVKRFGDVTAVAGVDLDIAEGEFFSMLGPSGSGKTTCLRMIAGFELPSAGRVLLGGVDVTGRAPYDRDVNTVFQDYALFPHMTVQEDPARVRNLEPGDHPERRRLPASRRPEQREELAVTDLDVELVDGCVAPEALADTLERDRAVPRRL